MFALFVRSPTRVSEGAEGARGGAREFCADWKKGVKMGANHTHTPTLTCVCPRRRSTRARARCGTSWAPSGCCSSKWLRRIVVPAVYSCCSACADHHPCLPWHVRRPCAALPPSPKVMQPNGDACHVINAMLSRGGLFTTGFRHDMGGGSVATALGGMRGCCCRWSTPWSLAAAVAAAAAAAAVAAAAAP